MMLEADSAVFVFLVGSAVLKHTALVWLSRKHCRSTMTTKNGTRVGTLSQINLYPVKSMRGLRLDTALCDSVGLRVPDSGFRDRCLMVCSSNYGHINFVTARQQPRLVLIEPSIHEQGNVLHLSTPGVETLKLQLDQIEKDNKRIVASIWDYDIETIDCGDAAATWISDFLNGYGLRILYHADDMTRRKCADGETRWHRTAKPSDQVAFQDGFPFMLMSESSVQELNSRLNGSIVAEMDRFRPNFVVSGSEPFDEDSWKEISIGSAVFTNIKPCQRCILTTVDTTTGERDSNMEPLRTLRSYRLLHPEFKQAPCFGINLVTVQGGQVSVGDEIWVTG